MPPRVRQRNEIVQQVMPLLLLGVGMVASNNYFTVTGDEASILDGATRPVATAFSLFMSGSGSYERAPLYDLILHFLLRWTGGNFEYLRIPAILFYLAGLFFLGRAAKRLGGPASAASVIWLGALWPFGFHYGRLAAWYSFAFFLVAGLTLAYLRYLEEQTPARWAALFFFGASLLWTSYFAWALLVCLAIDQFIRHRSGEPTLPVGLTAGTFAMLVVASIPLIRAYSMRLPLHSLVPYHFVSRVANTAFNFYSLFVSESVAPWRWLLSVPAGLAIVVCVYLALMNSAKAPRRFLLYGILLVAVMGLLGILATWRLLLIAPWVLLPIGIAAATISSRWMRAGLAVALLVVAAIGWYGIRVRTYYSAPRFLEPWLQIAGDAADKLHSGATVISDNPSFFLYLTYILRPPGGSMDWKFSGMLPDSVHYPKVMSPEDWIAAGHPYTPTVIWIRGSGAGTEGPMEEAVHQLDRACGARTSRLLVRDSGYEWKRKFYPDLGDSPWRIEIREYDCAPATSPEIFPIPVH